MLFSTNYVSFPVCIEGLDFVTLIKHHNKLLKERSKSGKEQRKQVLSGQKWLLTTELLVLLLSVILLSLSSVCFGAISADFGYEAGMGKQRDTAGAARGQVPGHFPCSWTGRGTGLFFLSSPCADGKTHPTASSNPWPFHRLNHILYSSPGKFGAPAGVEQWLGNVLHVYGSPDFHRAALRIRWWLWWGLSLREAPACLLQAPASLLLSWSCSASCNADKLMTRAMLP